MDAPIIDIPIDREIAQPQLSGAAAVAAFRARRPLYYLGESTSEALGNWLHKTEQLLWACHIHEYKWTTLAVMQLRNNARAWWRASGHNAENMSPSWRRYSRFSLLAKNTKTNLVWRLKNNFTNRCKQGRTFHKPKREHAPICHPPNQLGGSKANHGTYPMLYHHRSWSIPWSHFPTFLQERPSLVQHCHAAITCMLHSIFQHCAMPAGFIAALPRASLLSSVAPVSVSYLYLCALW